MLLFLHKCKKSCTFVPDFEIGGLWPPYKTFKTFLTQK